MSSSQKPDDDYDDDDDTNKSTVRADVSTCFGVFIIITIIFFNIYLFKNNCISWINYIWLYFF